jgi:hypothetical protein
LLAERGSRQGLAMSDVLTAPAALARSGACDIIDWLVGDECHELDLSGLTAGFGVRLRAAGISLDRFALHLRTLHPLIRGRTIAWAPNEAVEFFDHQYGTDLSAQLKTRSLTLRVQMNGSHCDWTIPRQNGRRPMSSAIEISPSFSLCRC